MPTIQFLVRPTPSQVDQLLTLYRQAGWWADEAPDDPGLVARIVDGSHCVAVARAGDAIVGMGRAISDGASDAYIQDVTVLPAWQGRGLASRIVAALVERLQADGLAWIGLIAERRSDAFYRRLGFAPMPASLPMRFGGAQ